MSRCHDPLPLPVTKCHTWYTPSLPLERDVIIEWPLSCLPVTFLLYDTHYRIVCLNLYYNYFLMPIYVSSLLVIT